MKKNKIMSIGLFAILGLSIISFLPVNFAYAQQEPAKITGLGHNILELHYQESEGILWALGGSRTGTTVNLLEINPTNNTLMNTYNVTSSANGGSPWDLWCGVTACYISTRTPEGSATVFNTGALIRVATDSATRGTVEDVLDASNTARGFGRIEGRDSTATGIGGVTIYAESYDINSDIQVVNIGGLGTMTIVNSFPTTGITGREGDGDASFNSGSHDLLWSGSAGQDENYIFMTVLTDATGTNERLFMYDVNDITEHCAVNGVSITANSGGGQIIYDPDNKIVYVASGDDGDYYSVDVDVCGASVTDEAITNDDTGLSGSLTQKNGIALPDRDAMFFQESGGNARLSLKGFNFATETFSTDDALVIETSPNNSQPARFGRAYYALQHDDNGQKDYDNPATIGTGSTAYNGIFIPMNNDQAIFIFKFSAPGEPEEVTGINCELPANQNILICRLTDETGGNIGGLGGILDTGLFTLFTNSGIIDGSDTDPQTNGIGYFITIAGFGVMTAMFFIATKGRLNEVPTFIWMLSAIALLGAITAIGWLDPTFLIIGIIAIVALASMQVRNTISSGLDFGGRGDF